MVPVMKKYPSSTVKTVAFTLVKEEEESSTSPAARGGKFAMKNDYKAAARNEGLALVKYQHDAKTKTRGVVAPSTNSYTKKDDRFPLLGIQVANKDSYHAHKRAANAADVTPTNATNQGKSTRPVLSIVWSDDEDAIEMKTTTTIDHSELHRANDSTEGSTTPADDNNDSFVAVTPASPSQRDKTTSPTKRSASDASVMRDESTSALTQKQLFPSDVEININGSRRPPCKKAKPCDNSTLELGGSVVRQRRLNWTAIDTTLLLDVIDETIEERINVADWQRIAEACTSRNDAFSFSRRSCQNRFDNLLWLAKKGPGSSARTPHALCKRAVDMKSRLKTCSIPRDEGTRGSKWWSDRETHILLNAILASPVRIGRASADDWERIVASCIAQDPTWGRAIPCCRMRLGNLLVLAKKKGVSLVETSPDLSQRAQHLKKVLPILCKPRTAEKVAARAQLHNTASTGEMGLHFVSNDSSSYVDTNKLSTSMSAATTSETPWNDKDGSIGIQTTTNNIASKQAVTNAAASSRPVEPEGVGSMPPSNQKASGVLTKKANVPILPQTGSDTSWEARMVAMESRMETVESKLDTLIDLVHSIKN